MSQEKVAKYKQQKANRKAIMKKEKIKKTVRNSLLVIVCVAVIGWVGYSAVDYYQTNKPREVVEVDYTAVSEYETGLSAE